MSGYYDYYGDEESGAAPTSTTVDQTTQETSGGILEAMHKPLMYAFGIVPIINFIVYTEETVNAGETDEWKLVRNLCLGQGIFNAFGYITMVSVDFGFLYFSGISAVLGGSTIYLSMKANEVEEHDSIDVIYGLLSTTVVLSTLLTISHPASTDLMGNESGNDANADADDADPDAIDYYGGYGSYY
jgi:hypothetical protein